jgi:prepilin-type processing-associated H-X9-DG protein
LADAGALVIVFAYMSAGCKRQLGDAQLVLSVDFLEEPLKRRFEPYAACLAGAFVDGGLRGIANGIPMLFADGHVRNFPGLTSGPFRYGTSADVYLEMAQRYAHVPVKQAVVSASALSLLYPQSGPGPADDRIHSTCSI